MTLEAIIFLRQRLSGGLIDCFVQNWIPLFKYHAGTYIMQIIVGLCFTAIYFFVFRYLILKNDYKTPGRTDDDEEDKLFSKAEDKAKKEMEKKGLVSKGDGKAVDHIKPLSKGGSPRDPKNLRVVPASENNSFSRNKDGTLKNQTSKRERRKK